MNASRNNAVQATLRVQGTSMKEELRLISMEGEEGISRLFSFRILLATSSSKLALGKLVGKPALVSIITDEGQRLIHGMIRRLEQRDSGRKFTVYSATLVPAAWSLTQRFDCRIFQKKHIGKIIGEVLDAAHIPYQLRSRGNQDPPARDYCVQYRESDWAFISRLLEEEGYHFYFEHSPEKHILHISNDSTVAPDITAPSALRFRPPGEEMAVGEHVYRLYLGEEIQPGAVSFTDYNFEKPTLNLRCARQAERDQALEVYDYPGVYQQQEPGQVVSQVRLEELRAQSVGLDGESDCPRLASGHGFSLDGHTRADLNHKRYLLLGVTHRLIKSSEDLEAGALDDRCIYESEFQCIPRDLPFRPPRTTPRPVVRGVQTAVVVGPSTEEIYTDEHGRVKVQFHWDRLGKRDEDSSCWVRVSQQWAGNGWGAMLIPRIGQEVIVDFLEGDPDRPIITGRVYHAQHPPPYPLPAGKTRSTIQSNSTPGGGGSNEIRFEDKKGTEEVYVHAQRDQNEVVEHDMTTRVGRDQSLDVGRDRSKTVGQDETTSVGRDRTEAVGRHETISVQGDRTESVSGMESVSVTKNREHLVRGNQTVTVRKDATLAVMNNETEKVGLKKWLTTGGAYLVNVGAKMALTVGTDMVRNVVGSLSQEVGTTQKVTVGSKLEIVCGASRLVMEKSGRIIIEGNDLLFKVAGPMRVQGEAMQMKGASFKVKTSGPIQLKGSEIGEN